MRREPSLRAKLAAMFLVPLGLFGLLEAGLRVVGYEPQPGIRAMRFVDPDRQWAERGLRYRPSGTLFWEFQPGNREGGPETRINALGFRGDEIPPERLGAGVRRVLCLGDSSTYGFGLDMGDCWPRRLAGLLDPPEAYEVVNCGVPGYSSHQGLRYLTEKALPLSPWGVVLYYGRNDGEPALFFTDREQSRVSRSPLMAFVGRSRVASGLRELLFPLGRSLRSTVLTSESRLGRKHRYRVSPEEHGENLAAMVCTAREAGVTAVLCTYPYPSVGDDELHRRHAEEVRRQARRLDAPLADLALALGGRDELFLDDCHPNPRGARAIAEHLAEVLRGLTSPRTPPPVGSSSPPGRAPGPGSAAPA